MSHQHGKTSPEQISHIKLTTLLDHLSWAFKHLWFVNPSLMLVIMLFTVICGVFPAGLALITRTLVNTIVQALNTDTHSLKAIVFWLVLSGALTILQGLSNYAQHYITLRFTDDIHLATTSEILTHASSLEISFFESSEFQNAMERVQQNTAVHLTQTLTHGIAMITNSLQLSTMLVILIVIEPLMIVGLLPLLLPYFLFHTRLARTRYQFIHRQASKRRWTRYFVSLLTHYQTVAEVKLLDLASRFIKQFRTLMTEFRDENRIVYRRSFLGNSLFTTGLAVVFYVMFARVIFRALAGGVTIGDVVIFGAASATLRRLLSNLIESSRKIYEHTLHIQDFRAFLRLSPGEHARQGVKPTVVQGAIEVRDLCFTYAGAEHPSLHNLSFDIHPGEIVAFVGENGAGKTTLAKLISHLYATDSGTILIDGVDLREWDRVHLYKQIAFVFQEFGRYEASVADNIAYGDWRRLLASRRNVEEIARRMHIHDLIEAMPQGYETLLGRLFGAYQPSGGQWQNIAIARAFARDAAILILDEPTSNLDARAEYELFSRFRKLAKGRTTILISHRFSTVSIADRIIMLDEGRIVETGTHQDLLELNGAYASLYRLHRLQATSPDASNIRS